jgi:hypothetical protein
MDRKRVGLLATGAATLICGCPGIFICLFGALSAAGLGTYTSEFGVTGSAGQIEPAVGLALLCAGLVFMAIPLTVGFILLRRKPEPVAEVVPPPS